MSPRLHCDQRGVVYAEFLMAFMPMFLLFLGIIQLCFIGASSLVVQNAAMKGARAAMVVLPDDPFFYEGEDVLTLDFQGSSDNGKLIDGVAGKLQEGDIEAPEGGAGKGSESSKPGPGGPRLNQIRFAINVALAPIGPQPELLAAWMPAGLGLDGILNTAGVDLPKLGIRKGTIGTSPALRFFTGLLVYNPMAAAINFPREVGSTELLNAGSDFDGKVVYKRNDMVTVRVTYLYPCTVPIVSRLICRSIYPGPDSWVAKTKRWGDELGSGGEGLRKRLKERGRQLGGYAGDQWEGVKNDARDTLNAPRDAVMNAAKCVKTEAQGFKDGIREEAFALRDGVVGDVNGLRKGLRSDATGLRDGVLADARGLIDGTRADVAGLGKGLVTDGKSLVGGLKGDARKGMQELEAEGARVRDELARTGREVGGQLASEADALGQDLAKDGRGALGQLPGGDIGDLQKPVDDTAKAANELGKSGKELYGVGQDVYRLANSPYDPFATAAKIGNATDTVGRVVETTDAAGRRVVVGLNQTGQQVVKTFDAAGGSVAQTVNRAGELVAVTTDAAGRRIETTIDKAGTRIERGVDEAGRQVELATDRSGKVVKTTIDSMNNRVIESYDQTQGRVIATVDSVGNRTVTTIDSTGKRVDSAYTAATTRLETTYDSLGNRTRTAYDNGVKRYESTVDKFDQCTETGYDALGKALDDPTKAFTDRASGIQSDAEKLAEKVDGMSGEDWQNELLGELRELTPEEQALMDELRAGTTAPDMLDMLLLADNARFYVLRREATLPLQGAAYRYPTFKKFKDKDDGERADARE
jgi:TadE-like protein